MSIIPAVRERIFTSDLWSVIQILRTKVLWPFRVYKSENNSCSNSHVSVLGRGLADFRVTVSSAEDKRFKI